MEDHKRLDELRRRVEKDPASIAFASLAEELRRTGNHDEAVRVCRAGLVHHPTYLSARVTLGRTLLELQRYPEARTELDHVIHAAPDNLLALKCMSELQARAGNGTAPEHAHALGAAADLKAADPAPAPVVTPPSPPSHPALRELEQWQAQIQSDRAQRTQ